MAGLTCNGTDLLMLNYTPMAGETNQYPCALGLSFTFLCVSVSCGNLIKHKMMWGYLPYKRNRVVLASAKSINCGMYNLKCWVT